MATNVVMPKMGESITEGTILRWLKSPGDAVKKDEPLLEISTDKVDTEVPAPFAGVLLQQLVQEKQTVAVGTPLAVLGEAGEKVDAQATPAAEPTTTVATKPAKKEAAAPAPTPQPAAQPITSASEQAIVMPKMGESITEGTILRWLKKVGDVLKKDEALLEIATDKVDTEVPSPVAGTLTRIVANEKDVVAVGNPVAYISATAGATISAAAASAPTPSPAPAPTNGKSAAPVAMPAPIQTAVATPTSRVSGNRFYSPLVRSIARKESIAQTELDAIAGSGLGGRVNKNDILGYLQNRKPGGAVAGQPSFQAKKPAPVSQASPIFAGANDVVVPMDNIRQKIAEHMVRSVHTSAHVTSISEVDVTNIVKFRERFKEEFKQREGVNLTYTPIMITAMVKAIKDFPFINSQVNGTDIIIKKDINFGVAVSLPPAPDSLLPPALIVPIIKRAQDLNLVGIAKQVSGLAEKARTKKLTPDDISGGTFALTNPGMFGNLFGTPIISQPNVAIMTTGAIVKRAVVKTDAEGNDYITIRSMMYLGLSYDHRVIDGQYGVQFTERVKHYLEIWDPNSL